MDYTKGEWYHLIDKENRHHVMSHGKSGDMEQNVAVMSVRPEAEANAHLIAAAPRMYEALKQIREYGEKYPNHTPFLDTVKQALAKAEEE